MHRLFEFAQFAALLLAGCATHTHIGDCISCSGYVHIQGQVADEAQTKAIYGKVGAAMTVERDKAAAARRSLVPPGIRKARAAASVAPVRSQP